MTIGLGEAGERHLVNVGDSAFPCLPWLAKCFNENTRNSKEGYFNGELKCLWQAEGSPKGR